MRDKRPWRKWLDENLIELEHLPSPRNMHPVDHDTLMVRQHAFGYTVEDLRRIYPCRCGSATCRGTLARPPKRVRKRAARSK